MTWRALMHQVLASFGAAGFAVEMTGSQSFWWLTLAAYTAFVNLLLAVRGQTS